MILRNHGHLEIYVQGQLTIGFTAQRLNDYVYSNKLGVMVTLSDITWFDTLHSNDMDKTLDVELIKDSPYLSLTGEPWGVDCEYFGENCVLIGLHCYWICGKQSLVFNEATLIARFMGPTWGPSGAERTQVGPMLAPWTLLSFNYLGYFVVDKWHANIFICFLNQSSA